MPKGVHLLTIPSPAIKGIVTVPEQLLEAVHELTRVVKQLQITLERDYPKRAEIERRFVTESQSRTRRNTAVFFVLITIFISYFVTVSTISYCFLGGAAEGRPPRACGLLPGYNSAQEKNAVILRQFQGLLEHMQDNRKRINKLERQVAK
jgi:hypothetical protein